jgi:hypothetical protein
MIPKGTMGRTVRLYEPSDYFWQGKVVAIDSDIDSIDVDYGDWIQRYPSADLRDTFMMDGTYENVLIPFSPGICVVDYRDDAA